MENQLGSSQPTGKKLSRAVALPISRALPLALLFVLCASLSQTNLVHAQGSVLAVDTLAGYNLGGSATMPVPPPAATPTPIPAIQYLLGTGEDSLATGAAPWWVIVVALTVLVIELGSRVKRGR